MFTSFTKVKLKTNETMEIGVITAPDLDHADEIKNFLKHKPGNYRWHIDRCVDEKLDQLETRFYVGKIDNKIITNVMITEHNGIGTLGHVFTIPDQRRKGACSAIMKYQMEDFVDRGGKALYLGTGFDSPPYHIYKRFGFESVFNGSGFMQFFADRNFLDRYFQIGSVSIKEIEWHDWAKITALVGITIAEKIRSITLGIYGPTNFEGNFLHFKDQLENGDDFISAKLLVSEFGAIVGIATLKSQNGSALLDFFVHPNFASETEFLLKDLDLNFRDLPIKCQIESSAKSKIELIRSIGFRHEKTIIDGNLKIEVQHFVS